MTELQIESFPLSPQQKHLWSHQSVDGSPYQAQTTCLIEGDVDLDKLKSAIHEVVKRHEILRTAFHYSADLGAPVQVIVDDGVLALLDCDLSDLDDQTQQSRLDALILKARDLAFDFENGRLLNVTLITLAPKKYLLLVVLPALCTDTEGLNNVIREIARSYEAQVRNKECSTEVLQYIDIATWANEVLETQTSEIGRTYWRNQPLINLQKLRLPFENQPSREALFRPDSFSLPIPPEVVTKVIALANECETTVSAVLLSCFQVLLCRITGKTDIMIGTIYDGRNYEELKDALGLVSRVLPVRCILSDIESFKSILKQVYTSVESNDEWQESFSWEQVEESSQDRENRLFAPICFEYQKIPDSFIVADLHFSVQQQHVCFDRFKIRLSCTRKGKALDAAFHYDSNCFDQDDVKRLARQFQSLLDRVVDCPSDTIGEFSILSEAERQLLVLDFNNTKADYPQDKCIHHFIEGQAERTPGRVAIDFQRHKLSYADLDIRANKLARRLQKMGVAPDSLVAICVERSLEMIVGILGILKAGGAYVPLDPAYPGERLAFMLEDTSAQVLLTQQHLMSALPEHQALVLCLDSDWASIENESGDKATSAVTPGNLVYVIYTSGSTGQPKGVIVTHQDLVISHCARADYFSEDIDVFLLLSSLSFDSSVVGIFWTLCKGGTLLLIPEEIQNDLLRLVELVSKDGVSHLLTLPSFYALLLEHSNTQQLAGLKTVIVAGEPCPLRLVEQHKLLAENTKLYSEYGATETTVFSSVYNCLDQTSKYASLGSPISNAQMYILDPNLQPVPTGVPGEVYFGGDALAEGYLNRPDLTAERFIPNPFSNEPGMRMYKSGDLARHLPNGVVEFLGRVDNQVKIRGFRVELEEIEAVLSQYPSVRESAVAIKENAPGSKHLVAYVANSGDKPPTTSELRRFLKEKLPEYMIPAVFVMLDSLPKTPNGKVDRAALPDPGSARPDLEESFVAPSSEIERKLAEIWAEVLNLEEVGIHDNFFELGGDSISSIQIIAKANQSGLHLTPMQMFQHQVIAELARVTGTKRMVKAEQGSVTGKVPLTPIQHWFFEKNLPDPDHWNISLLLEVHCDLSRALLERLVRKLLAHHDALRQRFIREPAWQGTIDDIGQDTPLDRVDLSSVPEQDQMAAVEKKTAEFQASLNLASGPLIRLVIFDLGANRPSYLLWVLHHLTCDIISWRILLEDLQSAIKQPDQGTSIQLPPKTTSFKRWAELLPEYAQTASVKEELDYWAATLRAGAARLPLDFAHDNNANSEASARTVSVSLNAEETHDLLQQTPKAYNTQINDILLTALLQAFSSWTGESSLLINLEGHGREDIMDDVDLSRTVGWFTIFYPVLLSQAKTTSQKEIICLTKERLRSVPNRGLSYVLLRYLCEDPDVRHMLRDLPQPEVDFNYLGQLDQVIGDASLFSLAQETSIHDRSPRGNRVSLLGIDAYVKEGRLHIEWIYSANLHRQDTIAKLAADFLEALRSLIRHCQSPETGGFTPSDFSEFDWGQAELDNITAAIFKSKGED